MDHSKVPTWDELTRLADELEHAEYILALPELQEIRFFNIKHPLLLQYRQASLRFRLAQPPEVVTQDPEDHWSVYRLGLSRFQLREMPSDLVQAKRETGGLRRAADLEALFEKKHRDFTIYNRQKNPPENRTRIIKHVPRRKQHVRSLPWRDQ